MEAVRLRSTTKIRGWEGSKVEMGGEGGDNSHLLCDARQEERRVGFGWQSGSECEFKDAQLQSSVWINNEEYF